jgi:hypothetical protein
MIISSMELHVNISSVELRINISLYFFLETHMYLEVLLYPCNPVFAGVQYIVKCSKCIYSRAVKNKAGIKYVWDSPKWIEDILLIVVFVEINTYVFNKANGKYTSISQYFGCKAVTLIRNGIWQYLSASIIWKAILNMSVKYSM